MVELYSRLKESTKIIDGVTDRLDSLKSLFTSSTAKIAVEEKGFKLNNNIEVISIHENKDVQILQKIYHKVDSVYERHTHEDSIEYLIVVKGKIAIKMGEVSRILSKGECASIPVGINHSEVALEDESEVWAILIPPEKYYSIR